MYQTIMFDPTGRVAGKSYTDTREAGKMVGQNWGEVYAGNAFQIVETSAPARGSGKGSKRASHANA